MLHPILTKFQLLGGLVHDLGSKQVFEVLVGTSVALAQRIVVIHTGAEGSNYIVGIQCRTVGEQDTLFEATSPFGCIGIASAAFSQIRFCDGSGGEFI